MEYLATFYTHYGAMRFKQYCVRNGLHVKMAPVPRELSASCGICARFESGSAPDISAHEDMEQCFGIGSDGGYKPVTRSSENGYTEDK